jgi:quinol monooxygenase YgiN
MNANRYKDAQALNIHGNTPHFKEWQKRVGPLMTGPAELKFGRVAGGILPKL